MDAAAWNARYAAGDPVWSTGPNRFVAEECARLRPGRAVDLAAGEGRNAIWLAEQGWQVTAVDFAAAGLVTGRRLLAARPDAERLSVTWVHEDVLSWSPGADRFDLTVLAYLQLTGDELRTAVRVGFGALAVGGTFLLVAHDSSNLLEGTGGPQDPTVLYTAEDVLEALDGERFEVERAERVARPVSARDAHSEDPRDDHRGDPDRTAWDVLVRLVRTG